MLFVRYRDIEPIWDVVMQITFYASPIFYTAAIVRDATSETVLQLMLLNPFAAILQQARHAVVDPSHESAAHAMGSGWLLLVPAVATVALLYFAYRVFDRAAPRIAEDL